MFLMDSEAITVLCVFSIAEEITNASGSTSRAAMRQGTMCRSGSSSAMRLELGLVVQVDQLDLLPAVLGRQRRVLEIVERLRGYRRPRIRRSPPGP